MGALLVGDGMIAGLDGLVNVRVRIFEMERCQLQDMISPGRSHFAMPYNSGNY